MEDFDYDNMRQFKIEIISVDDAAGVFRNENGELCTIAPLETTNYNENQFISENSYDNNTASEINFDQSIITSNKKSSVTNESKYNQTNFVSEKPYECNICGRQFTQMYSLRRHQRIIHGGEKLYQCSTCSKKFSQNSALIQHERVHTGEKPFECSMCDKKFTQMFSLKRHIKSHHQQQSDSSTNDETVQNSISVDESSYHSESMTTTQENVQPQVTVPENVNYFYQTETNGIIPYTEENKTDNNIIVGDNLSDFLKFKIEDDGAHLFGDDPLEEMSSNVLLKTEGIVNHSESDTPMLFYTDSITEKINISENEERDLNKLLTSNNADNGHSDQDNSTNSYQDISNNAFTEGQVYQCDVCSRHFQQFSELQKHEKIHTSKHECEVCMKKFRLRYQLKVHERIHTGEQPYQCNICSRKFTQAFSLKRHEKIHNKMQNSDTELIA